MFKKKLFMKDTFLTFSMYKLIVNCKLQKIYMCLLKFNWLEVMGTEQQQQK